MAQINPYIHFNGNAEEAFTFYQSVFGGEFAMIARFKDFSSPEFPVPEKQAQFAYGKRHTRKYGKTK